MTFDGLAAEAGLNLDLNQPIEIAVMAALPPYITHACQGLFGCGQWH
jgi:hypothetical protein